MPTLVSVYDGQKVPGLGFTNLEKKRVPGLGFTSLRPIKKKTKGTTAGKRRLREIFSGSEFVDWGRTNGGYGPQRDRSAWVAALREFNKNNTHAHCTPRKGSQEYKVVKAIQRRFELGGMDATKDMPAGMRFDAFSRLSKVPAKKNGKSALEKQREDAEFFARQQAAAAKRAAEREAALDSSLKTVINEVHQGKARDNEPDLKWVVRDIEGWSDAPAPKVAFGNQTALKNATAFKRLFSAKADEAAVQGVLDSKVGISGPLTAKQLARLKEKLAGIEIDQRNARSSIAEMQPDVAIRALEFLIEQLNSGIYVEISDRAEILVRAQAELEKRKAVPVVVKEKKRILLGPAIT